MSISEQMKKENQDSNQLTQVQVHIIIIITVINAHTKVVTFTKKCWTGTVQ